ncbi:MAG: hypothetical protein OEU76_09025 [Cyclobacteriaceae bacterium]|nr:hypothetical protein [Cyclobacteriaceae bacterium]
MISLGQTGSEIYLFDVKKEKGRFSISSPVNITNHPGYDNQPSFHSNKPVLYYSSFNEDGRSDIRSYNYQTGETKDITQTQEREYSPTLTPDGKYLSCIIQRDNDAQDMGKYPVDGGEPVTLIDNLVVGYHAWVDHDNVLLFVLGEPLTLRWRNLSTGEEKIWSENIGRSLHKIPKENAMSFVHKISDEVWMINQLDIETQEIRALVPTLPGREDLVWTQDGKIIMSDGEKLFICNPKEGKQWTEIGMNTGNVSVHGITRLALSNDGKKMAVVVSE